MSDEMFTVEAMARAWGRWQREESFPFQPDHCINGTRVVCRAMEKLDVRARPVSVCFLLFNRFAWDLYQAGIEIDEWPDYAWSLGVGPGHAKGGGKWDGHLCAEGNGWTLDISAAQFNRPGKIISTKPRILPQLPPSGQLELVDGHEQHLIIGRWPENNGWRSAGGWLRLHGTEVRELVERTTRIMKGTA